MKPRSHTVVVELPEPNAATVFDDSAVSGHLFSWDETLTGAEDPHFHVESETIIEVTNGFSNG